MNIHVDIILPHLFLLWNFLTEFWSEWTYIFVKHLLSRDFPNSSVGKESTCIAGDPSSIPGSGRSPGERKGYPLQYSVLKNSMDCTVHVVAKNQTRLSDFHFTSLYWRLYYWRLYDWSQRENKLLDFDTLFCLFFPCSLV